MKHQVSLALLLVAFLAVAGLHNLLHPIWEAPEEPHHYAYIRHLVEQRSLPQPEDHVTGRAGGENETHQTPLYYIVQALLVGWVDDGTEAEWHRNPYATWPEHPARLALAIHRQEEAFPFEGYVLGVHWARFVSTLMSAGTVLATYLLARRVGAGLGVGLAAAGIAAFTPGFAFLSATISNDIGVTLASALVLLHCLHLLHRPAPSWRDGAASGALLAIAALTKLNGLQLGVVVAVTWGVILWRGGRPALRRLAPPLLAMPVTFASLVVWWLLAIWDRLHIVLFSSAIAWPDGEPSTSGGFTADSILATLNRLFVTYWGAFGWTNEVLLPDWVYTLLLGTIALAAIGWLIRLAGRGGSARLKGGHNLELALLGLHALLSVAVVVIRYEQMPLAGVWDGRFLYPALPAFSVLIALGLASLGRGTAFLPAIPAFGLCLLSLWVPLTKSVSVFPAPVQAWGIFPSELVRQPSSLGYANGVFLVGFGELPTEVRAAEEYALTAYWRASADQQKEMRPIFRLVDPTGESVVADHTLPQEATFPPNLWQRGEVVEDSRRLKVPDATLPGEYILQLRVVQPPHETDIALQSGGAAGQSWQEVARVRVRPEAAPPPATPLAPPPVFGGQVALTGYALDKTAAQSCLTLYWQSLAPSTADYHVSVQSLEAGGKLLAQHDGVPHEGRYPVPRWEKGESVPDRHCLDVDDPGKDGRRLLVVVYDPADGKRLRLPSGADFFEMDSSAGGR